MDATKYRLQLHVDVDAPAVTIECLAGDPAWAEEFARRYDDVLSQAAADPSAELFTRRRGGPAASAGDRGRGAHRSPRRGRGGARPVVERGRSAARGSGSTTTSSPWAATRCASSSSWPGPPRTGCASASATSLRNQTVRELASKTTRDTARRPVLEPFALVDPADRAALPPSAVNAYPVTALQAGMLYHAELAGPTAVYREQVSMRLRVPAHSEAAWRAGRRRAGRPPRRCGPRSPSPGSARRSRSSTTAWPNRR